MTIFGELTLLVIIAALVAFLMRLLKQPMIIGYIFTGLIAGPLMLDVIRSQETLHLFSEIGIALLLFIVGLNLTPKTIKNFGKVAAITGIGQVAFTFLLGWLLSRWLGFSGTESAYLSIGLALSSTIIILKLLSDKGDLNKLYGRIAVGFLLMQDVIAILLLFFIPLFSADQGSFTLVVVKLASGLATLVLVYLVTQILLPKIHHYIASSQEMLFLFAIAWGLGLASLFRGVGFSLESGALIAGVSLSTLPSSDEIHARLKPLRDFFIVLFFVLLGTQIILSDNGHLIWPAIILSLFVLIGNPLIMIIIMGIMGYRKKTSFQTGLAIAQVSEFSLILMALGLKLGHINQDIMSLATMVGVVTIFVSTYLIMNNEKLYELFRPLLHIFERKQIIEKEPENRDWSIILFGLNRIGFDFQKTFKKLKKDFLVVDYNPDVIQQLEHEGVDAHYGDAGDLEFLRMLNLHKVKMVVSTIPDNEVNMRILNELLERNSKAISILVAENINEATDLYESGANYVIMPHFLGGETASQIVSKLKFDRKKYTPIKTKHIKYLKERKAFGHEHPKRRQ